MRRLRRNQIEMFTLDEMKGGVERRDIFMDEYISAYLKHMQKLSELDDDACRDILKECEAMSGKADNGVYCMKTLHCSINVIQFDSLKEMLNMRLHSTVADEYNHHEDSIYHTFVSFPSAFDEARKIFKEKYSENYKGKDAWISDKSESELL